MRTVLLVCLVLLLTSSSVFSQTDPLPFSQLDPKQYDPDVDPDIDMFIGNWKDSMPRHLHGSLIFRDILTKCEGDPLKPVRKGAVLTVSNAISYATLSIGASTTPSELVGEQQVFYVQSGIGVIKSGTVSAYLREGNAFIITPGLDFMLKNTGDESLTFFVITEPIPEGFTPNTELVVTDKFDRHPAISVHWVNTDRGIINSSNGMTSYSGLTSVQLDPMTFAQPHSHNPGVEEVWIALRGDVKFQIGKELRSLPVGSAYRIPSTGITAHANINMTDEPITVMHMMKSLPGEPHPYGQLEGSKYNPDVDPVSDMFIGNWRESMPRTEQGSLIERDMLTSLVGPDPLHPTRKSAVLTSIKNVGYGSIEAYATTQKIALAGEQKIYYVVSGTGTVTSGGKTESLHPGTGVLMPPDVEFSMTNIGDESLKMYIVAEPIPDGFTPNKAMLVKDERDIELNIAVHWANIDVDMFGVDDGLATLARFGPVMLAPMTIAQPHSHAEGVEEVWFAVEGDIQVLLGKQLRKFEVGSAYKVPANGICAHANINRSDDMVKVVHMMVR